MKKGDHHVSHTGIEICGNGDKAVYGLWDKQENHAEINFCEFDVPDDGKDNFFDQILKLSTKGRKLSVAGNAPVSNLAESHVQGVIKYQNYYIMSHNNKGASKGVYVVSDKKGYKSFNTYDEHYNHPGGMQRYENYMLVGVENSKHSESYIRLYDLSDMSLDRLPRICEDFQIKRTNTEETKTHTVGTCAVGICRLKNEYVS